MAGRIYPRLDDREWLRMIYEDEKRSTRYIAGLIGCSAVAVGSALRLHGIPRRVSCHVHRQPVAIIHDPQLAARLGLPAGVEVRV